MSSLILSISLFKSETEKVHVHTTANAYVGTDGKIDLKDILETGEKIDKTAPVFVMETEADGSIVKLVSGATVETDGLSLTATGAANKNVFVDFYVNKESANVSELQIDAENFAGNYYVEASTLFRRESDGVDMPAEITLPNVKIQSNFTFSMASTGDPSTFTFTMDAFPGYTLFDHSKKVLCVIQVVEDAKAGNATNSTVMGHEDSGETDTSNDSVAAA